ncbi:MAG: bifunctional oligoribonuclease/PAP phosphatase NrnA [Bacillus sp. (in: firmicutes)]
MKEEILKAIEAYETIIIHRHVRPDPDAYGSQGGLAAIIQSTYPDKKVFAVGEEEASLAFLRRLDVIPDEAYKGALAIVCDTANEERVCDQRYRMAEKIIKIDHHPNEDPYGDLLWVDTAASSASEMIYNLYEAGKEAGLVMTDTAAMLLYAGIVGDTGRFLYPSTSNETFRVAGELVGYDFNRTELYNRLYDVDEKVLRLNGYVFQNFEITEAGAGKVVITKEMLDRFSVTPSEASLLVSTLGSVKGLKAWVFFIEEEKAIRVRLRSKGPIINTVAKQFNGGGHPLASGASIEGWDEVEKVMEELEKACRDWGN